MAELALGVLGIVPLIGVAVKSYSQISSKLKHFRHYSTKVERVRKRLKVQRQTFINECKILLQLVGEDEDVISAIMSESKHDKSNSSLLEQALQTQLGDNRDAWFDLVHEVCNSVKEFDSRLACFDVIMKHKRKKERLKDTIKRVQDGITVAFDASEYDKSIEDLKSRNSELKHLREQITQLQKPTPTLQAKPGLKRRASGSLGSLNLIQHASKALYDALVDKWKCSQPGHISHALKLFVDTSQVEGEVLLHLAIVCQAQDTSLAHSTLVQLEVRSQKLELTQPKTLYPPMPSSDDCVDVIRKRAKVVRFEESSSISVHASSTFAIPVTTRTQQSRYCISSDLGKSKDICMVLTRKYSQSLGTYQPTCLGHLDGRSERLFRHSFYPAKDRIHGSNPPPSAGRQATRIDEIVMMPKEKLFTLVDKLKVARALVSTVLKFHSTPWLRDYWRLQDLALFHGDGEEISQALQTLHVSTEVAQQQLGLMEDIQEFSQVTEDELTFCGIDNMTLHSLGVALLQIDRMVEIEPGDVMRVRKMAMTPSTLGPRYRDITQKCIRCDFGYGSDLTKPRLQEAICDSVIGELEKMISQLSVDDD